MLKVIRTTSEDFEFKSLVNFLDKELNVRYGMEQSKMDVHNSIESVEKVVLGYDENGPIACGCIKAIDPITIELKRMFVKSEHRGNGIAGLVLLELENWAKESLFEKCILETGIKQPEAIHFYTKMGYLIIGNFGPYINNPNSICMGKEI